MVQIWGSLGLNMGFARVRENRVFPSHLGFMDFYGLNMGFVWVRYGFSGKAAENLLFLQRNPKKLTSCAGDRMKY